MMQDYSSFSSWEHNENIVGASVSIPMSSCAWTSSVQDGSRIFEDCTWSDTDNELPLNCMLDESCSGWDIWEDVEWSTASETTEDDFVLSPPCKIKKVCHNNDEGCNPDLLASPKSGIHDSATLTPVRKSPRTPKPKRKTPLDTILRPLNSEPWQIFAVLDLNGCAKHCACIVHGLSELCILQSHMAFATKSLFQQRQWLFDYLSGHCPFDEAGNKNPNGISFILCGREVCQSIWLATLSISQSRFYEIRREFMLGSLKPSIRKSRPLSPKSLQTIAWMRSYFDRIGDKRPDKEGIYLPSCLTERSIYEYMVETLHKGRKDDAVCLSQFNKLFRASFSNVTIPKACRFTKCNLCTLIKEEMNKLTVDPLEKEKLKNLLQGHLKLQEQERNRYYKNRQNAVDNPQEYLSLILDGMDQNKTNLPHLIRVPKSCQNLWCLRTHLTGCLVHGIGVFGYFDYLQWSRDTNLTLTCLMNTLKEIGSDKPLPRKLLLQMDNCVRENKNKYVMGFLSYLVEKKIFLEIEIGFLMVGHTHEDIDQTFSCLSRQLHKNKAHTMPELHKQFLLSSKKVQKVTTLEHVFDVKGWIAPYLDEIHHHTVPHVFLFKRNKDGQAVMFSKQWSSDSWEPKNGLKLLIEFPKGCPPLVVPKCNKVDITRLTVDATKYEAAGVFSCDQSQWWTDFVESFDSKYSVIPKNSSRLWPEDQLKPGGEPDPVAVDIPEKILDLRNAETTKRPMITIGKQSKKSKKSGQPTRPPLPNSTALSPAAPPVLPRPSSECHIGNFVALRLSKYDEVPQIGQVVEVDDLNVTVEWRVGTFSTTWSVWKDHGVPVKETFPKNAVIYQVTFTKSMRLAPKLVSELKLLYNNIEMM